MFKAIFEFHQCFNVIMIFIRLVIFFANEIVRLNKFGFVKIYGNVVIFF